jgi:prophage maintenance system killer protein
MRVFLKLNGFQVNASQEAKVSLILQVVDHKVTVQAVAEWLAKHTRRL